MLDLPREPLHGLLGELMHLAGLVPLPMGPRPHQQAIPRKRCQVLPVVPHKGEGVGIVSRERGVRAGRAWRVAIAPLVPVLSRMQQRAERDRRLPCWSFEAKALPGFLLIARVILVRVLLAPRVPEVERESTPVLCKAIPISRQVSRFAAGFGTHPSSSKA